MIKTLLAALLVGASLIGGAAVAQTGPNTLGKIKAAKVINVAYSPDSLPFSFAGPSGVPVGFSIELCKRAIAQISRTVGVPDLKVNWLAGSVTERLQMVASGRADLECANTTQTLGRLADVDFSNLVFVDGGGLLVKSGAPVNQIADLAGKRVAVVKGTTTEARLNATLKLRLINATVVTVADANAGLAMLEAGSVDAYAGDKIKLVGLAVTSKNPAQLALVAEDLSIEPYAFALPRFDSALRLEVNRALTQVYLSGDIERIYSDWLGKLGRPSPLLVMMFLMNSIPE
jgi:ABC-type amino acid transport substrate-binding protein